MPNDAYISSEYHNLDKRLRSYLEGFSMYQKAPSLWKKPVAVTTKGNRLDVWINCTAEDQCVEGLNDFYYCLNHLSDRPLSQALSLEELKAVGDALKGCLSSVQQICSSTVCRRSEGRGQQDAGIMIVGSLALLGVGLLVLCTNPVGVAIVVGGVILGCAAVLMALACHMLKDVIAQHRLSTASHAEGTERLGSFSKQLKVALHMALEAAMSPPTETAGSSPCMAATAAGGSRLTYGSSSLTHFKRRPESPDVSLATDEALQAKTDYIALSLKN
jgi:hypothetical protein